MLGGAPAAQHGDPHGVASGAVVAVGSGTTSGSKRPTVIVTTEPFGRGVSGRGILVEDDPVLVGRRGRRLLDVDVEARVLELP